MVGRVATSVSQGSLMRKVERVRVDILSLCLLNQQTTSMRQLFWKRLPVAGVLVY